MSLSCVMQGALDEPRRVEKHGMHSVRQTHQHKGPEGIDGLHTALKACSQHPLRPRVLLFHVGCLFAFPKL